MYLVVGLLAGRAVKNIDDYYVSGRQAPTILISGTLFASMLSVSGFMGDQGWVYSGNITNLVLLNSMCAAGYIFGPIFFSRYLRRTQATTMPEYYGARFNDFRNRRIAGVIVIISLTCYLVSSITGVGILMEELTGFSFVPCVFIAWLCFTTFTFYSGSKGVVITDTLMFIVFLVATIISGPYIFSAQGGIENLLTNLMNNPHLATNSLDFFGNIPGTGAVDWFGALMYGIIFGIIWFVTVGISPWQAGRNLMAKSEHVVMRSGAVAAICTVVFLLYLNLESLAVVNINSDLPDPQRVLIWAGFNVMPKIIGTVVMAGIMAAGLSSASTFLSVIGFSVITDVVKIEFKNDRQKLWASRIVVLLVGVVALALVLAGFGGVRVVAYFASTIIASSWVVPSVASTLTDKVSAKGARWGMIAGFITFLILKILVGFSIYPFNTIFVNFLDPFICGVIMSAIFTFAGSKLSPPTNEEIEYQHKMQIIPEEEKIRSEYKRDYVYGYLLIAFGIITTIFLLFGWALPYNGLI